MTQQSRKPIARRRPGVKAGIEDRLTALVAKIVKLRDNWTCQKCYRTVREESHAHHVIPKSQGKILRWDLDNLLTLCPQDHEWAHRFPKAFRAWFRAMWPDRDEYIEERRNKVCKFTEEKLREMENLFEQELLRAEMDPFV